MPAEEQAQVAEETKQASEGKADAGRLQQLL